MARNIRETVKVCLSEKVPLEVRTTIVPTLVDDEDTMCAICKEIVGMGVAACTTSSSSSRPTMSLMQV